MRSPSPSLFFIFFFLLVPLILSTLLPPPPSISFQDLVRESKLEREKLISGNAQIEVKSEQHIAADLVCTVYLSCGEEGSACNRNTGTVNSYHSCERGLFCNYTTFASNFQGGACIAIPQAGDKCSNTYGLTCTNGYQCTNGTCMLDPDIYQYEPGMICESDDQCYLNWNTNIENSTCVNGTCYFIPDGGECDSFYGQCNLFTSDCRAGICTSFLPLGAACNASTDLCNEYNYQTCVPTSVTSDAGTCQHMRSATYGHACYNSGDCSHGFCSLPIDGNKYGTCIPFYTGGTFEMTCYGSDRCNTTNTEICSCTGGVARCSVFDVGEDYVVALANKDRCTYDSGYKINFPNGDVDWAKYLNACKPELCAYYNYSAYSESCLTRYMYGVCDFPIPPTPNVTSTTGTLTSGYAGSTSTSTTGGSLTSTTSAASAIVALPCLFISFLVALLVY